MESAIAILMLLLFLIWGWLTFSYVRALTFVSTYCLEQGLEIFGRKYSNIYHLMADINFLNELWSGEAIETTENATLKQGLLKAGKLLKTNMVVGLVLFMLPVLSAVVNA